MKNKIFITTLICFLIATASCKKDNFKGPDSAFFGTIKDSTGGGLIEQDMLNGTNIEAYEHGYANPTALFWGCKINGEFRNNMVFANTYDLYLRNGNFFPITKMNVEIKQGDNVFDFLVVPYLRIKDVDIKWDKTANKIIASFKIEGGKSMVNLKRIALYAWSDIYVGDPFKFAIQGGGDVQAFIPSILLYSTSYTLSIDLNANNNSFKSGRNYFFRIGALADVSNQGTVRYNYAPYVKITL